MTPPIRPTVHLRLIGTRTDVQFWLQLLNELATLHHVSDPEIARDGKVRVYAVVSHRLPPKGFPQ